MLFAVSIYPLLYEVNTPETVYFTLFYRQFEQAADKWKACFGYDIMSWTAQHDKQIKENYHDFPLIYIFSYKRTLY